MEDLKWLTSNSSNPLNDESPAAVSDFVWSEEFNVNSSTEEDDHMFFFPAIPGLADNSKSNNCFKPQTTFKRNSLTQQPDLDQKAQGETRQKSQQTGLNPPERTGSQDWIDSTQKTTNEDFRRISLDEIHEVELLSVVAASDYSELEPQPELAELGPFTSFVFGDEDAL
jgi:hypothetical protein